VSLKYRVFLHSHWGFNSSSTLLCGERDAILIDAAYLPSDTHKMVAEILLMRKSLTHIYVSHFHPDHYFGLGVLEYAFPKAKIVALPSVIGDVVFTYAGEADVWAIDRYISEVPREAGAPMPVHEPFKTTTPMPMSEPRLELEGHEILVSDDWEGDSINNSVVWIPSAKVLCAIDVAFHGCNLWPIESNVERRVKWRHAISKLREFDARVVIPGHFDEAKLRILEEAQEDTSRSYTDCIDWSLDYSKYYEDVYSTAKNGADFVEKMTKRYPLGAEDFAIHWQARLLFPRSSPDWLTPLPGEPHKIFLNPAGQFDGDPPKE
jgi:glyoxylase-like metal-dependent hydrolase (beta-lactamase superfamily II)